MEMMDCGYPPNSFVIHRETISFDYRIHRWDGADDCCCCAAVGGGVDGDYESEAAAAAAAVADDLRFHPNGLLIWNHIRILFQF